LTEAGKLATQMKLARLAEHYASDVSR